MRKAFGRQELDAALSAIADHLTRPVTCHLIGGCAMTFRGQKVATKDVDLVVLGSPVTPLRLLVRIPERRFPESS